MASVCYCERDSKQIKNKRLKVKQHDYISEKLNVGCYVDESAGSADDYRGEWLHVSDHGNATLYFRDETGKDIEIWSVV